MINTKPERENSFKITKPERNMSFKMTKHRDNGSTNNQIELVTSSSVPPIESKPKMSKQRNESQEIISHVDPVIQNVIAVMPNEVVK